MELNCAVQLQVDIGTDIQKCAHSHTHMHAHAHTQPTSTCIPMIEFGGKENKENNKSVCRTEEMDFQFYLKRREQRGMPDANDKELEEENSR